MSEYIIRAWQPEDRSALKELWKIAFGDSDEYIEAFFENFLRPEACVVADIAGKPVSAMYILPGEDIYPYRKKTMTAGYTYALATLPEYRSRGIGRAVYKAASDKVLTFADAACVLPAEKGLYPFYENTSGAAPFSFLREARLRKEELAGIEPCQAARIDTITYDNIREQLLSGMPHASFPPEFFDLMESTGMEFFVLANGVAAAETEDGVCRITELLDPGDEVMRSVAGVARWCPAREYIIRTPLFFEGPGEARSYMLAALKETPSYPMAQDLWWGFGLE